MKSKKYYSIDYEKKKIVKKPVFRIYSKKQKFIDYIYVWKKSLGKSLIIN